MALKVWINQDLCTGDGLCAEIAPDVFFMDDDGLARVKEEHSHFSDLTSTQLFDGRNNPDGSKGLARVPLHLESDCQEAQEECPGECIFFTDS